MELFASSDNLELSIPSISPDRSSKLSFLSSDSCFDEEYHTLMDYELNLGFVHSPRPASLFPQTYIGYQTQYLLQIGKYDCGELSPIQELPELIYEAVKIMNFDQCLSIEKRKIRTIRYKRINPKLPIEISACSGNSGSRTSKRRMTSGIKEEIPAQKQCKKPLFKKCIRWAFTCIAWNLQSK